MGHVIASTYLEAHLKLQRHAIQHMPYFIKCLLDVQCIVCLSSKGFSILILQTLYKLLYTLQIL